MTRHLVQVWAMLLLVTLFAVVAGVIVLYDTSASDARVIEHSLQGGVRSAVLELDAAADPEATRALLEARFGYPVVLIAEPPPRPVYYYEKPSGESFVEAPLERGGGVRMGPFPQFGLPGAGRVLLILLGVLSVSGLAAALLLSPQLRMIRAFEAAVARLETGDWGSRVGPNVPAYARPLAAAFDRMAGEIEDHIAARKRLLQVVSHELRTPLSRVQLGVDLLVAASEQRDGPGIEQRAGALERDIDELDALVEELQEFVRLERPRQPRPEPLELDEALLEVADARRLDDSVRLALPELPDGAVVVADRRQFARAVGNLVSNALRHAATQVHIGARQEQGGWTLWVDDDGPGVPMSARERIWKPFERAVDVEVRGSGLGLAIVHRIVTDHGGTVGIEDSPLGGARFVTHWPRKGARQG